MTKTADKFAGEVRKLADDEYELLTEYQGSTKPVQFVHRVCGHTFMMRANNFLYGQRCPKCAKKRQGWRWSTEKFRQRVFELEGNNYEVVGDFTNVLTPVAIRHNQCGRVYKISPRSFLDGRRCRWCVASRTLPHEFEAKFYELEPMDYELLTPYVNSRTSIRVRHRICGHEWSIRPSNWLDRHRCPRCCFKGHKKKVVDDESYRRAVFELTKGEYIPLETYKTTEQPLLMKHQICGTEWTVRPRNFLLGSRCPSCARDKKKKTHEQFVEDVRVKTGSAYQVVGKYVNSKTPILLEHTSCGTTFQKAPDMFLLKPRCPSCNPQPIWLRRGPAAGLRAFAGK